MNQNQDKLDVSLVIPLLNESESLPELHEQIQSALGQRSFEIIFVDDGSTDTSWSVIQQLQNADSRVRGIQLRRNYGKSVALQKGFERACGKYVATLDADLQDDPKEIPLMIAQLEQEGLDLVSGWKKIRHDPISKTIPSRFFNFVTSKVSGIHLHDFNCGLKVYRRELVQHLFLYGELHRYVPLLAKVEGYSRIGEKIVQHHPRKFGKTKFGLSRFIKGFLDLITLYFMNNYVQRPMHFFGTVGTTLSIIGIVILGYLGFMRIVFQEYLSNRPVLIFAVLMVLLGAQSFGIGLLGELSMRQQHKDQSVNIKDEL